MMISTPVLKDPDLVLPGESWFFYWKTSASLWKEKLSSLSSSYVYLPINWALHSDTGDNIDFGELRPETDLVRLIDTIESLGKKAVFLLPVTPAPFLPNGGVPHLLARGISLDRNKLAYMILDSSNELIKIYSFYSPKVFQYYSSFVKQLTLYLKKKSKIVDFFLITCGFFDEDNEFQSFLTDRSEIFYHGLTKFIKIKREESDGFLDQKNLEKEYESAITDLYLSFSKGQLGDHCLDHLKISFLGSSRQSTFERFLGQDSLTRYISEISHAVSFDALPSSVLLPVTTKSELLVKKIDDLVTHGILLHKTEQSSYVEESTSSYIPLTYFEFYETASVPKEVSFKALFVMDIIDRMFGQLYLYSENLNFIWSEEFAHEKVYFFQGGDIDRALYQKILKIFMNGGKVVINRDNLDEDIEKSIEAFVLENSLAVERINMHCFVQSVTLGESGQMILFSARELLEKGKEKCELFFFRFLTLFGHHHPEIVRDDELKIFWLRKNGHYHEMNFDEMRRINIYNPTSYKKKFKMKVGRNFALTKIIDEKNCKLVNTPGEIFVDFLPHGSLSIELGVFTE